MAKVRITSLGKNAKQLNWPVNPGMLSEPEVAVNKTLAPVDRSNANLEAEVGETVVADLVGDGIPQQYNIGGKRHSAGGTPLNLPKDSFIFSRDNKMKIKDEKIQKMFGMAPLKSGYTPAEIAKKYDLNRYRKVLADPDTDELQRDTAEMMIAQYNLKLAKLALVQESMKGFPTGIPKIAEPYVESGAINPEELNITQAMPEQPGQSEAGQAEMRNGGNVSRRVRITALPKAQDGTEVGKYALANTEKSSNQMYDEASDPRYDVAKKSLKQAYGQKMFNDKTQPFFGLPIISDDNKDAGYRNQWGTDKSDQQHNLTRLNINKLWQEEQDAKPLYTRGSPKRDLNKYLGTQKEGPKKMPGKAEAKKALTFDEKLKQAEEYTKSIPQEPAFWATLGDNIGHNINIAKAFMASMYANSPSGYNEELNRLAEESLKHPEGLRGIAKPGKSGGFGLSSTFQDEIDYLTLKKAQAEKDSTAAADAERKAVMDYLYATGQAKQPTRSAPKQKPIAQPYTNFLDYQAHLLDPYSAEKVARQQAYAKAYPEDFPTVNTKALKQYGGSLSQYWGGGGVKTATRNKTIYNDGSWKDNNTGTMYNADGTVYAPTAAKPAVIDQGKVTSARASTASPQQSKGDFSYVDRSKFSDKATQAGGYDVVYGPDDLGNLPSQKFDPKTNTYYHLDKSGKRVNVDMADFAKRHAWFADAVKGSNAMLESQGLPGVDAEKIFSDMQSPDKATRERATEMFQTAHSRMSKKLGIPQYFTEGYDPSDPTSIDKKFGNYTENAPVFRRSAPTAVVEAGTADKKKDAGAGIKENPLVPTYDTYPEAWFPQDLNNIALAQKEKGRIPQEMEWGAIASGHMAPYVLRSPERALQANAEAYQIAAQNMGAYGSSPTANRSSLATAAGKAAANAANIEAQVEADNIGTQNAAWARNADTANRMGMYAAGEKSDQYHNQLGMNRDRISALNKADREIVRNINQGMTNVADAYNTNLLNENYKIRPGTGGKIEFTETGRKVQATSPADDMAKKFLKLKGDYPNMTDDAALKILGLG